MKSLNLQDLKVVKSTINAISEYVYENRNSMSIDMKLFYNNAKSLIEFQLTKPVKNRLSMTECLERAYNIETYVMNAGAASFSQEYITL